MVMYGVAPGQSSRFGWTLAITEPFTIFPAMSLLLVPCVCPEMRFRWPITVVPNSVSKKLSLMAKFWA